MIGSGIGDVGVFIFVGVLVRYCGISHVRLTDGQGIDVRHNLKGTLRRRVN